MDYDELLDLTVDLAYQLQQCGAETYRVEETIVRLLGAYGVEGSAFSIPGCIIVSLETAEEKHMTRMHRAAYSSTDLDGIERYSGLCRRICQEKPPVQEAMAMIQAEKQATKSYRFPTLLMGYFLAAAGFSMFFRGTLLDALCAGLSGLATGLCLYFMNKLHANLFFKTVAAGFVLALLAHGLAIAGLAHNVDAAIIGALMLLVPGLLFTNSIRDIIYGDTMSGVNRLVQVLITAVALAVGTGAAVTLARQLWGDFAGFVGSLGFCILLNLHGPGMFLCIAGSILSWLAYRLFGFFGMSDLTAFLLSAATISVYAEIMARIRKCPATSYLLVALFPLVPGADIYYTMDYAVRGNTDAFLQHGLHTGAIAGTLAVGILLVSTAFRMWGVWRHHKKLS